MDEPLQNPLVMQLAENQLSPPRMRSDKSLKAGRRLEGSDQQTMTERENILRRKRRTVSGNCKVFAAALPEGQAESNRARGQVQRERQQ
jgi:hypothetical protein